MTTVIKRGPWTVWKDVIFALFAREIRTGFNDKLGLSWAVVNPVMFIFILSFIRGRLDGGESHTIPTFAFMAFGMLLVQLFLQTLSAAASSIKKNKALFAFRQVQPISAVIAASLFELLVTFFVMLGILLIMYFLKMDIQVDNVLLFLHCLIGLWVFSAAVGMIFGVAELFVKEIGKVRSLATRPLFFISGVFFSLQDIPKKFWPYLDWNPILHAIELARFAAYPSYGSEGVSLVYLLSCIVISLFFALSIYSVAWRKAISR
ncbi:MAG: ABC transporter permease [Paraglaciecola sp.]|uniref:ABC transporter permease n=1 Tax=Paraglaciecola sp. TaxID=1920173 RepID=UPI003265DC5E